MSQRALLAIVLGLLAGAVLAWWQMHDTPPQARAKHERARQAASAQAADTVPSLYRWRDAEGVLQVTEQPPKGRQYQRIPRDAPAGIEVRGD